MLVPVQIGSKTTLCETAKMDTLYLCDPKLNIECRKTNCKAKGGECYLTKNPAYAKTIKKDE